MVAQRASKTCPDCKLSFEKAPKVWVERFNKKVNTCPYCSIPIFYRKEGRRTTVILYDDKYCAEMLIKIKNDNMSQVTGMNWDDGAATGREWKFAYEMIDWGRRFLEGAEFDLGWSVYEFLENWLRWVIKNDWWKEKLDSLVILRNARQALANDYYQEIARQRGITLAREARVQKRLQQLAQQFAR